MTGLSLSQVDSVYTVQLRIVLVDVSTIVLVEKQFMFNIEQDIFYAIRFFGI